MDSTVEHVVWGGPAVHVWKAVGSVNPAVVLVMAMKNSTSDDFAALTGRTGTTASLLRVWRAANRVN